MKHFIFLIFLCNTILLSSCVAHSDNRFIKHKNTQEKFIDYGDIQSNNALTKKYIKVVDKTKIYSNIDNRSIVVTQAVEGDIFEIDAISDKWYRFFIMSGEYRYLLKQHAITTNNVPALPKSENKRKEINEMLILAEKKARIEAENKYPNPWGNSPVPINWEDKYKERIDKLIDLQRILQDRYALYVCQKYNISTIRHIELLVEGHNKKWR